MKENINKNKDENKSVETDNQLISSIIKDSEEFKISISLPEILLEAIRTEAARKKVSASKAIESLLIENAEIREILKKIDKIEKSDDIPPGTMYAASGKIFKFMSNEEINNQKSR